MPYCNGFDKQTQHDIRILRVEAIPFNVEFFASTGAHPWPTLRLSLESAVYKERLGCEHCNKLVRGADVSSCDLLGKTFLCL